MMKLQTWIIPYNRAGLRLRRSGTICLRWMIQRPGCAHPAAPRATNAADVGNHPTRRRCAAKTKESAPRWPWAGRRWQPQPPGFEAGHPAPRQRWLIQRELPGADNTLGNGTHPSQNRAPPATPGTNNTPIPAPMLAPLQIQTRLGVLPRHK